MNPKVDIDGLGGFVAAPELKDSVLLMLRHLESLRDGSGSGSDFLGWMKLPEQMMDETGRIRSVAATLRQNAGITVVIGIGGSYLGARAVIDALSAPFPTNDSHRIIWAGHHLGEDYHAALADYLAGKNFNIIVISKSGTTTEPAIAFRMLKSLLEKNVGRERAGQQVVAITDSRKGALHDLAQKESYTTFVIPDDVGGRFSVLTPVGLLPIAVAGFDPVALLKGAAAMALLTRDNNDPDTNPAITYATARNLLREKGFNIELLANFEPSLHYISEWWKQLFGESEGKNGKGIFPASVDFTTDLHSMGQYIQDGPRSLFETVIRVENSRGELVIPFDNENADKMNFVAGKRLSEVNQRAADGTVMAHADGGVPVMQLVLPVLNEENLGRLLYFFEISCAISGYALGVNPFDQPGVEAYKKNMFRLLGKE